MHVSRIHHDRLHASVPGGRRVPVVAIGLLALLLAGLGAAMTVPPAALPAALQEAG